jgi:hypothetical protein
MISVLSGLISEKVLTLNIWKNWGSRYWIILYQILYINPDKTEIMLFKNVENSTNFDFSQILVECKLSIISINFVYLIYILIYAKHVCLETLFIKFSTCLFHFASSLNVIPKCLWSDVSRLLQFPESSKLTTNMCANVL